MDEVERKLKIWELLIRGVGTLVVSILLGSLALLGNLYITQSNARWKESELRQASIINTTQIANAHKQLEINVATKLWEDLTRDFFPKNGVKNEDAVLEEQIFRLRLTALNFQDIAINLKPFFERLK